MPDKPTTLTTAGDNVIIYTATSTPPPHRDAPRTTSRSGDDRTSR